MSHHEFPPTLDEVCTFIVDCLHKTAPTQEDGYPLIRTPNIGKGRLLLDGVYRVSEQTYEVWTQRAIPEPNDLILAREAPAGNIAIVREGEQVALGQRTVHLRPDPSKIDPAFLCYFLLAPKQQGDLLANETGATAKHVNMKDIRRLKLNGLPDKSTQKKIASILSSYDDLIENNQRRARLLENSIHLLFNEWFLRLRFPGYECVKINKGIPQDWEDLHVPDIIEINPKTSVEKEKEILYVPMSALSEVDMTANSEDFEKRTKHTSVKFKKDDVLLARITPCLENGKTGYAYFLNNDDVACGSTEFIVLRGSKVSQAFTYALARSYGFREHAIKSMTGSSGRQRVQADCFTKFPVLLPPSHLLQQFDKFASSCIDQICVLMDQVKRLEQARDLLLPRLMNGDITV